MCGMDSSVTQPRTGNLIRSPKIAARRGRLRDNLLSIAAERFAAAGIQQVSVEEILEAAGTSRATFYGFFANKAELMAAIIAPVLDDGIVDLEALCYEKAEDILPGIVATYLRLWDRHRDAMLLISSLDESVYPHIADRHETFITALCSCLESAANAGQLRNGSADYSLRLISRTAVPLLRVYQDRPDLPGIYTDTMLAMLAG